VKEGAKEEETYGRRRERMVMRRIIS